MDVVIAFVLKDLTSLLERCEQGATTLARHGATYCNVPQCSSGGAARWQRMDRPSCVRRAHLDTLGRGRARPPTRPHRHRTRPHRPGTRLQLHEAQLEAFRRHRYGLTHRCVARVRHRPCRLAPRAASSQAAAPAGSFEAPNSPEGSSSVPATDQLAPPGALQWRSSGHRDAKVRGRDPSRGRELISVQNCAIAARSVAS